MAKDKADTAVAEKPADTADTTILPNPPANNLPAVEEKAPEGAGTALEVYDFGSDAGAGLQNITSDEYAIPFINVIQSNSPQLDRTHAKFMPAAKSTMIMKSSTGELFEAYEPDGKSVTFIPVDRDHHYVEYTPRDSGGGFVGIRPTDDPLVVKLKAEQGKFGTLKTSTGTELTEMFNLYGLFIIGEDYVFRAILGFKSTQIKKYQAFMETIGGIEYPNGTGGKTNPPMWAHKWKLTTVPEKNKKGNFIGIKLALANGATSRYVKDDPNFPGPRAALIKMNEPLYTMGKEFYLAIQGGKIKVDREGSSDQPDPNEDIPF